MQSFFHSHKLFLFLLLVLAILVAAVFFAVMSIPRAVVMTDPVWDDLYLRRDHQLFSMEKLLLKHRYFPLESIISLESPALTLEGEISARESNLMLLSPHFSGLFLDAELGKKFPEREFILVSMRELSEDPPSENLHILRPDPKELAELLASVIEEAEVPGEETGKVLLFREEDNWIGSDGYDILVERMGEILFSRTVESAKSGKINTASPEVPVIVFSGSGGESREVLQGLSQRGGKAVVVGDGYALTAWPGTVVAAVVPDIVKTLAGVLENRELAEGNQKDSILFSVKGGK